MQDELPEADESFLLNITEVRVMSAMPPPGAEPSVKVPGNILRVTINENDGIRGIVQFNVTTVYYNNLWECFCHCGIILLLPITKWNIILKSEKYSNYKLKMIRALNEHYILTLHLSFLNTDVNLNFIIIFILIQMSTVQKYYIIKLTFSPSFGMFALNSLF